MEKITTLERLIELANEKRAVSFLHWKSPKPAAVIIGMTGRTIYKLMEVGLYLYEKNN